MKKKILLIITAVILLFTGAFVAANYLKEPAKADGTTIAWIDAPLDKMRLPLEPYEIVFHASDASAIVKGEITINGQLLVELDTNYKESLMSFRHVWTPVSEGEYIIEARGQNDSGQWSEPAKVLVYIGALEPTETPTPVFTYANIHRNTFTHAYRNAYGYAYSRARTNYVYQPACEHKSNLLGRIRHLWSGRG